MSLQDLVIEKVLARGVARAQIDAALRVPGGADDYVSAYLRELEIWAKKYVSDQHDRSNLRGTLIEYHGMVVFRKELSVAKFLYVTDDSVAKLIFLEDFPIVCID